MGGIVFYKEFGATVKRLRIEKGWTQEQLGDVVGTTKAVISKYETGASYPPYDVLARLSNAFKVSTDYMLGLSRDKSVDLSALTRSQFDCVMSLINEFEKANKK